VKVDGPSLRFDPVPGPVREDGRPLVFLAAEADGRLDRQPPLGTDDLVDECNVARPLIARSEPATHIASSVQPMNIIEINRVFQRTSGF
jgi:hypothetical protein